MEQCFYCGAHVEDPCGTPELARECWKKQYEEEEFEETSNIVASFGVGLIIGIVMMNIIML